MARPKSGTRDPLATRASPTKARAVRAIPHAFVLDELAEQDPRTRPMFGCLSVYVGDLIVFILRDRGAGDPDDGVWIGFAPEREAEVRARFPRLQNIEVFEGKVSGWLKLSARDPEFEDDVLDACALVRQKSPLLGKLPGAKKRAASKRRAS
jgi:hypothetical protein